MYLDLIFYLDSELLLNNHFSIVKCFEIHAFHKYSYILNLFYVYVYAYIHMSKHLIFI